jgi:hypothetical protein
MEQLLQSVAGFGDPLLSIVRCVGKLIMPNLLPKHLTGGFCPKSFVQVQQGRRDTWAGGKLKGAVRALTWCVDSSQLKQGTRANSLVVRAVGREETGQEGQQ